MLQHYDTSEKMLTEEASVQAEVERGALVEEDHPVMQSSELEALAADLQASIEGSHRRNKRATKVVMVLLGVFVLGTLGRFYMILAAYPTTSPPVMEILPLGLACLGVLPTFLFGMIVWLRRAPSSAQERLAAERLMQWDDPRAVALLLDHLDKIYTAPLRPALWKALTRLMPRMEEEAIRQISAERVGMLAHWILRWDDPLQKLFADADTSFLRALLPMIAQRGQGVFSVGTVECPKTIDIRPALRRWANGQRAGQDREVQRAAAMCLAAIERQMAQERSGKQLLRGSAPTSSGSDNLLRAAQSVTDADPQELLRPGSAEPE